MSKKHKRAKSKAKTKQQTRMYAGAKSGRLMTASVTSSADAELYTSFRGLRDTSRRLVRDNVYALRAKQLIVNNVIGQGVPVQGRVSRQRGEKLLKRVNDGIERAWNEWQTKENCHVAGELHFADLERLALGEVWEAGEVFIRKHMMRAGDSRVLMALEVIESERVADDHEIQAPAGARVVMGVEQDDFGRPLAYYFHRRHPNEVRNTVRAIDSIIRVPASEVMHLRIINRWPQTRGVPGLHAAITNLHQLGEYIDHALTASRVGAAKVGFFEAQEWAQPAELGDTDEPDGQVSMRIEAGQFTELPHGYKFTPFDPTYPVDGFDPFVRACLRGIAAGLGVSYESISKDYSQSNYSSSRLSLLDDRDGWRALQSWWVRAFREPLHVEWMQQAVLSGAIPEIQRNEYLSDSTRYNAVRFKLRGWGWVDPAKEVAAYKEAERAGYMTKADIIAATGGGSDLEDVVAGRRQELDLLAESDVKTDTTDQADAQAATPPPVDLVDDESDDDEQTAAAGRLHAIGAK